MVQEGCNLMIVKQDITIISGAASAGLARTAVLSVLQETLVPNVWMIRTCGPVMVSVSVRLGVYKLTTLVGSVMLASIGTLGGSDADLAAGSAISAPSGGNVMSVPTASLWWTGNAPASLAGSVQDKPASMN